MAERPDEAARQRRYVKDLTAKLPPAVQAKLLFEHFTETSHPNCAILHIPSCRDILAGTYETIKSGDMPDIENILLLFGIFAGAAYLWSSPLLQNLHATRAEAEAAFVEYSRLGISVIDNTVRPLTPSTTTLAAMCNLLHVTGHARGMSDYSGSLRMKCYAMARSLQVDRLDTTNSRLERAQKGCNMIEIEVQRRIWWYLVGGDWCVSVDKRSLEEI
jgi:hypothetical protein